MVMSNPTRRTIVKGAAWSVPVVSLASTAQAATCSPNTPCPIEVTLGTAYKSPGNSCKSFPKGYVVEATIYNPNECAVTITSVTMQSDLLGTLKGSVKDASGESATLVGAKQTANVLFSFQTQNSSNLAFTYTITTTYTLAAPCSGSGSVTDSGTVSATPPDYVCGSATSATTTATVDSTSTDAITTSEPATTIDSATTTAAPQP